MHSEQYLAIARASLLPRRISALVRLRVQTTALERT
jgi:hypothetical protein